MYRFPTLAFAAALALPLAAQADQSREIGTSYRVVDTGQSQCYDTGDSWGSPRMDCKASGPLSGQDAQYTINSPRYRDNGDGTVSDLVTGLMWERAFRRNVAWNSAAGQARQATTGGHRDWRVPSTKELYSLINFDGVTGRMNPGSTTKPSDAEPYLNTELFDFEYPSDTPSGSYGRSVRYIDAQYIAATVYRGYTMHRNDTFFGVNFADGRIKGYPIRGKQGKAGFYLRLVRGNPAYGINKFANNGDGTATDAATGLTWMIGDSGHRHFRDRLTDTRAQDGRMDWVEALAFCEDLDFAGQTDWRLPNAKELHSLLDYSRSPQNNGSAALDPLFHASQITDERGRSNFPGYWSSTSLLDGRNPGDQGIVVFFGEALGAFSPPGQGRGQGGGMGGGKMGGPGMGAQSVGERSSIIDVHGAGAQRSDPKVGDFDKYPVWGHGPQGDVRRVYNHARCVRG
ncbi:DUF1566 domain-containing protein [Magnetospira sp. QH-2]|uniref:Lcl C-terminal domain-containing protein n=1 Tax=Magnetospira sp. (strain QH-2) TaxID=1288970 RepID=UPI0003E81A89|nr:DUF1566 domain-containing protein [Magnetospira sp. QH-2]CCQ72106.1 conserved protein of unknown function [Magnetospira sp. QH-2]